MKALQAQAQMKDQEDAEVLVRMHSSKFGLRT